MKTAQKVVLVLAVLALFLSTSGAVYYVFYLRDRKALQSELDGYTNLIDDFKEALDGAPDLDARLREMSNATLGFDRESVDSRFRDGLRLLARDAGMSEDAIVITAPSARPVRNPAVEANVPEFRRARNEAFIDMPDLIAMDAEVRGAGTYKTVSRLLALVQSQPWIWSVRGFTLKPQDRTAQVFDVAIQVTTAFMPDLAPESPEVGAAERTGPPPINSPSADQVTATEAIIARNIFAPPVPLDETPKVEIVEATDATSGQDTTQKPPAPPPPPPPYGEWRLTGVSGSPVQGTLAWMLNTRTGAARLLKPGEGVIGATLVEATSEGVVFEIGQSRYLLALNETLADRKPLE